MMFSQHIVSTRRRILSLTTTFLVICCIVIIYAPTPAHTHPLSSSDSNTPKRRYCSTSLFEAIEIICNGRYNTYSNKFPESVGNHRANPLRRLLQGEDVIYRPSLSGAVNECCRRPCGFSELRAYCAD